MASYSAGVRALVPRDGRVLPLLESAPRVRWSDLTRRAWLPRMVLRPQEIVSARGDRARHRN